MRYAFFGDIHSNIQALETVVADIREQAPDVVICTGDIVGYGANPVECMQLVRDMGCVVIAGNHDHAVIDTLNIDTFNLYAKEAALWAREQISDDDKSFLRQNPFVVHFEDFVVTHGSLYQPEIFNYIQTIFDAEMAFESLDKSVAFYGHTHVPITFYNTEPMSYSLGVPTDAGTNTILDPKVKSLCNVGSVGQPRDENPDAAWGLYDDKECTVEIRRVKYDIESAQKAISDAGLPETGALRLALGK